MEGDSQDQAGMSDEDAFDNEGFTEVLSRRNRRLLKASMKTCSTVITPSRTSGMTVLFVPASPTASVSKLSKHQLSLFLEALVPGLLKEARVNAPKNIIAVDAVNAAAVNQLLSTTSLCGLEVRSYLPRDKHTMAGVIRDVDVAIDEGDLVSLVSSTTSISQIRRLGSSTSVKLIFQGDCLPATVKVGLVRHPVRPFVPRPLQCKNCFKLGHVAGTCTSQTKCSRCGADHTNEQCTGSPVQCANCSGAHEATSKECPRLRREVEICKRMARDNSSHKAAAAHVRRKSRSASRVRKSRSPSAPPKKLQEKTPAQSCATVLPVGTPAKSVAINSYSTALEVGKARKSPREPFVPSESAPIAPTCNVALDLDREAKIFSMLKSLVGILRSLIANLQTPAAKAASQILDAVIPVMDCLVRNQ